MCFNCDRYARDCEQGCDNGISDWISFTKKWDTFVCMYFCETPIACARGFCGALCDCPDCSFENDNVVENSNSLGQNLARVIKTWVGWVFLFATNLHTLLCSVLICLIIYIIYQIEYETSILNLIYSNVSTVPFGR